MFDNVLVALDMSPAEQPIIACMPELKHWGVRHLTLTHVIQFGYAQGAALAYQQDYVDWLEKCAVPLRAAGLSVDVEIRASGIPADEILTVAATMEADLIVIGSRGQNLLSKLFLGSVAREVIRKTKIPLLLEWIEPSAEATQAHCEAVCKETLRHVLFATDYSTKSVAAERVLFELALRAQQVECIHVLSADKESESTAQANMTELMARIETSGHQASSTTLKGKPSSEIARHAASQDATLIIVGKHGQNWVASALIGSTAANLCEIAGRPVLMVP